MISNYLKAIYATALQGDAPPHMEVMVDDIAEVLNATNVNNNLHQYYRAGRGEDPVVHFYETFLSEYDPATRKYTFPAEAIKLTVPEFTHPSNQPIHEINSKNSRRIYGRGSGGSERSPGETKEYDS